VIKISKRLLQQTKLRTRKLQEWLKAENRTNAPNLTIVLSQIFSSGDGKVIIEKSVISKWLPRYSIF